MGFEGKFYEDTKETIKMKKSTKIEITIEAIIIIIALIVGLPGFYLSPDYVFHDVEQIAQYRNPNKGTNEGEYDLFRGDGFLLLSTHGGKDGYILNFSVEGDEEAAVASVLLDIDEEHAAMTDINNINVVYVGCCYPGAHQDGVAKIPYVVNTGHIATSEDVHADAFEDGPAVAYKSVPIKIVGTENNVVHSNDVPEGSKKPHDVKFFTATWKSHLFAGTDFLHELIDR